MARVDHPAYFAFIPGSSTWPGALGDFLASALNVYAGSWMESSGPSQVELQVLDWFKDWIGYPEEASGILLSGGSAANMTALGCARETLAGAMRDDLMVYVSDQAHSSLARAARALGFRPDQVRVLPVDDDHRMRPELLEGAMAADVAAGRRPLFVSVSAGSTNTGAIDPLEELTEIAHRHGAWLHVDAAYGGFAALTERGRGWLRGIELADSVTLDPHKWLYQPFECGCLLVREGPRLRRAFTLTPDYLADAEAEDEEVNFSDLGVQLTRCARALKVWMSVTLFGAAAFRAAIDASLDLARLAEARVREHPELELLSPAQLGIVCFRRRFPGGEPAQDASNAALVRAFAASGRGLVSSTRLHGAYAIRLCVLNHASTAADVERDARVARHRRRAARAARHGARHRPPGRAARDAVGGRVGRRRRAAGARGRAAVRAARPAGALGARRHRASRGAHRRRGGGAALRERARLLRHPRRPRRGAGRRPRGARARARRLLRRARRPRLGRRLRLSAARHRDRGDRPADGQADRRDAARADARRARDRRRTCGARPTSGSRSADTLRRLGPFREVGPEEHPLTATRAAAIAGAALVAAVAVIVLELASDHRDAPVVWAVFAPAVIWSFVGTGLYAWAARPANRVGMLMVLLGFGWFLFTLDASNTPWLYTVGLVTGGLWGGVFLHLGLSFPSGRLYTRLDRRLVIAGYFIFPLAFVPALLFSGPAEMKCLDCPENVAADPGRCRPRGDPHRRRRGRLHRAVRPGAEARAGALARRERVRAAAARARVRVLARHLPARDRGARRRRATSRSGRRSSPPR